MATTKTEQLKSHAYELVKQYFVYDVSLRCTAMYTAAADQVNGGPCMLTQYEYDGASSRIVKRKESNSTWNSTWDI